MLMMGWSLKYWIGLGIFALAFSGLALLSQVPGKQLEYSAGVGIKSNDAFDSAESASEQISDGVDFATLESARLRQKPHQYLSMDIDSLLSSHVWPIGAGRILVVTSELGHIDAMGGIASATMNLVRPHSRPTQPLIVPWYTRKL
jgi:hypothetical protein